MMYLSVSQTNLRIVHAAANKICRQLALSKNGKGTITSYVYT